MGHHPRDHPGGRAAVRGRTEDVDSAVGSLIHGPSEKGSSRKLGFRLFDTEDLPNRAVAHSKVPLCRENVGVCRPVRGHCAKRCTSRKVSALERLVGCSECKSTMLPRGIDSKIDSKSGLPAIMEPPWRVRS